MSWVKEALQGGEEERRKAVDQQRADELARQREVWEKAKAQADAKIQAEREKQEELARLKRLLDEREVPELLADIRDELGGDVIYKQKAPSSDEHKSWAAYGLVHSVTGKKEHYQGGDEETYEGRSSVQDDEGTGSGSSGGVNYTFFYRGESTPITGFRIAAGAFSHSNRHETTRFYIIAGKISAFIDTRDILPENRNWWFLKYLPRIPVLTRQHTELHSHENWSLSALLPDGKINPDSFNISPNAESFSTVPGALGIGPNPIGDRESIKQILAQRIGEIE